MIGDLRRVHSPRVAFETLRAVDTALAFMRDSPSASALFCGHCLRLVRWHLDVILDVFFAGAGGDLRRVRLPRVAFKTLRERPSLRESVPF